MSDYISYGQRMVAAVLNNPSSVALTPGEVDRVKAWGKQQDEEDAAQVREWAADLSQRAYAEHQNAMAVADEVYEFLAGLQMNANERRVRPGAAVTALQEAEQRLHRLRVLRKRVADQAAQAVYLNEQPHQVMDEMWRKFPGIGDRPTPPHGNLGRVS